MQLPDLAALMTPPGAAAAALPSTEGRGPHAALPIAAAVRRQFLAHDEGDTRLAQELLALKGYRGPNGRLVDVDGVDGPQTRGALRAYQADHGLPKTGRFDAATHRALALPFIEACQLPVVGACGGERAAVVAAARSHAAAGARELPANTGPWVRLYMAGYQGKGWPWCAGFATFVWIQAAAAVATLDAGQRAVELARRYRSFSCDVIAERAKADGRFVEGADVYAGRAAVLPGDLFLVQRTARDWVHVGVVTAVREGGRVVGTIEGNTNAGGSREGLYVLERSRRVGPSRSSGLDFVRLPFARPPAAGAAGRAAA